MCAKADLQPHMQVERAQQAMLERVAETFGRLTEDLLPRMQFRCISASLSAVQIEFTRDGGLHWEDQPNQLSGGQRSLVALAFLISVKPSARSLWSGETSNGLSL